MGLGLSLAPIGAYLAVLGQFDIIPVLYSAAVLFWVSGFDIIYALQDEDFDRSLQLNSIPVALGKKGALRLSNLLHVFCAIFILLAAYLLQQNFSDFNWLLWLASGIFTFLLYYQHRLVKPDDLSKVNLAFFTTNGMASLVFCGLVIVDMFF